MGQRERERERERERHRERERDTERDGELCNVVNSCVFVTFDQYLVCCCSHRLQTFALVTGVKETQTERKRERERERGGERERERVR